MRAVVFLVGGGGGSTQMATGYVAGGGSMPTGYVAASGGHADDILIENVCNKITGSIVSVKFEGKRGLKAHIEDVLKKDSRSKSEQKEWRKKMNEELKADYDMTTTGFVVGENQDFTLILTCAHSFQLCFSQARSVTAQRLDKLYDISVYCDHSEHEHRRNNCGKRKYTSATVLEVDPRKDLLLLRVQRRDFCAHDHQPLKFAENLPCFMGLVGMVSWPFERFRTAVRGHTSFSGRAIDEVTFENVHGYNFTALEVNISAEGGSSGAPLVDLESNVIGLLHGGRCECFTYFVCLSDIREILTSWGVIGNAGGGAAGGSTSARKRGAAEGNTSGTKRHAGDSTRGRKRGTARGRSRAWK